MFHADCKRVRLILTHSQHFGLLPLISRLWTIFYRKQSIVVMNWFSFNSKNPCKLGIKMSKNLFTCRDESIKSTQTMQGWKWHNNTTFHLLHGIFHCNNCTCNKCKVVFSCPLISVLFAYIYWLIPHVNIFYGKIFSTF